MNALAAVSYKKGEEYNSLTQEERNRQNKAREARRRLEEEERRRRLEEEEERRMNLAQWQRDNCYEANVNSWGKYECPKCGSVEGGTLRVITHTYKCENKDKEYCQKYTSGGRRRSRKSRQKRRRTHKRR